MKPWILEYMPKTLKEVEDHTKAKKQMKEFVHDFKKQKKKGLLVYGPSGCGKTSSIVALANEEGLELIEMNASDFRNQTQIDSVAGNASQQMSLFSKGKLILVDEIDGLSGMKDRGGIPAITKLIEKSAFPILLTANNPWDQKFSSLRKKVNIVQFETLGYMSIFNVLRRIADSEKIKAEDIVLKSIARRSGGDMRASINDFQSLAREKNDIKKEDLEELSQRNQLESIPSALVKVFKTTDASVSVKAFDNVQEDMDQRFFWIDENLPLEYKDPTDLANAYERLSKADVYRGRIIRRQHWRFLVYVNALMTAGVATAKAEKYKSFVQYKPTGRILKMWQANMRNSKKKAIAEKIAEKTHSSKKTAYRDTLPYLQSMFKNKELAKSLSEEFDLSTDEIAWLKK